MGIKTETIVKTEVIDDLDGKTLPDDTKPMRYQIQGKTYDLYFSEANRQKFLSFIEDVTTEAKIVQSSSNRGRKSPLPAASKTIREWAAEQGINVPPRGRVPQEVVDKYTASHA